MAFLNKNFYLILIVFVLLVSIFYGLPQFLIWKNQTANDQPFILSQFTEFNDEGYYYLQAAREAYDGHIPPKDFFFDRGEQKPVVFNPLPPIIFSSFIHLTGNINTAYILANFILPPILFLILFFLGLLIFQKNRWWSLFFSFTAILTPIALNLPAAFYSLDNFSNIILKNFYPGVKTILPRLFWSRVDYPMVTHLIYLPAIISFLMFWKQPKIKTAILSGIFTGLLFYTYFHFWTFWLTVLGLVFIYSLFFLRANRERIIKFLWLWATTAILSIPYAIRYLQFKAADATGEFVQRIGTETGKIFRWEEWPHYTSYIVFAALIYFFLWKKNEKKLALFFWAALIAVIIAMNAQFFTGFNIVPNHWPRPLSPIIYTIIFLLFYQGIKKSETHWPVIKKITITTFIIATALLMIKKTNNILALSPPPKEILESYTLPETIVESWDWLNKNVSGEPKIISPSFVTAIYLPAFTAARPFLPWGIVASLTNFEIEQRYLIANKIFKVSEATLEKRLRDGQGLICQQDCGKKYTEVNIKDDRLNLYIQYFKDQDLQQIPEEKISELINRYQKIKISWSDINAEYVYFSPWEKQFTNIDLSKENNLSLIFKNPEVEIYKILH